MTLIEEVRASSKKVQDLEDEVRANNHGFQEYLKLVRCNTLKEWSNQRDSSDRNDAVHGGNVRADIAVIKEYRHSKKRFEKWKDCFHRMYGVPFRYADQILVSALDFQSALNKRASVQSLKAWTNPHNHQRADEIIARADELIRLWREGVRNFAPGSRSQALVDKITTTWHEGYP